MSFADARRMLWDQEDPSRPGWFRQKRRRSVLGFMRELKIHSFYAIHSYCEMAVAA
jgi:predicted dehydrogenase